ncbi:uncharacterized protein LOC122857231 isoform X2 [Aphidius gifuensis]|uniref:uncharacterized protein LOC122857231 isoform X2 n=1 Tax=Aphidius gifuensis TaxID=684658 RepID=UPI001CDD7899|nr:uncharacterized protein LOC122857231 isoform X2 [Aphidius gifuensis]
MFILAVLGLLFLTFITTATAIFTVPSPDYLHGPKNYDISDINEKVSTSISSNEVMQNIDDNNNKNINESEIIDDHSNDDGQTMYVIEFESELGDKNIVHGGGMDNQSPLDPWSIVWYIGSFGGLVTFFLIVSCSEWCCRKNARPIGSSCDQRCDDNQQQNNTNISETPPPPYHLFAPPPYDSINYSDLVDKSSSDKFDIYVITTTPTTTTTTTNTQSASS